MKAKLIKVNIDNRESYMDLNELSYYNQRLLMDTLTNSSTSLGYLQIVSCIGIIIAALNIKGLKTDQNRDWIRTYCPYTFRFFSENKPNLILPYNREYKPLGMHPNASYPKINFEHQCIDKNLIDLQICPQVNSDGFYYLYHDGISPWFNRKSLTNYRDSLLRLLKFNIE